MSAERVLGAARAYFLGAAVCAQDNSGDESKSCKREWRGRRGAGLLMLVAGVLDPA